MVGTRESGVNRQSMLCLEPGRLGFPEEVQGSEVCAWIKAAVSLAIRTLRTRAVESCLTQGAEMGIDGNWERGRVWFNKLRTENRAFTIYRRINNSSSEMVYARELIQGWNGDFAALWVEATDEANLRE